MNNITPENEYNKPSSYKDLVVWQKSIEMAIKVIDIAENLGQSKRHFRLIEQLEAAVTSVPMMGRGKGKKNDEGLSAFPDDCKGIAV